MSWSEKSIQNCQSGRVLHFYEYPSNWEINSDTREKVKPFVKWVLFVQLMINLLVGTIIIWIPYSPCTFCITSRSSNLSPMVTQVSILDLMPKKLSQRVWRHFLVLPFLDFREMSNQHFLRLSLWWLLFKICFFVLNKKYPKGNPWNIFWHIFKKFSKWHKMQKRRLEIVGQFHFWPHTYKIYVISTYNLTINVKY